MKYKVIASDPLYDRMLRLELDRMNLTPARDNSREYDLLVAEGQTDLPRARKLKGAVFVECGLLSAGIPDDVKVLVLDRPFPLAEFRDFVKSFRKPEPEETDLGVLILDEEEKSVIYGDAVATLTGREYALFSYLYARPEETVSRAELLHAIWQDEEARDTNIIDVYVKYIRAKLDERFGVRFIKSIRGEGYAYSFEKKS